MLAERFHPHVGGVERHLREVVAELVSRGHRVTVVAEQHDPGLPEEEQLSLGGGSVRVLRVPQRLLGSRSGRWGYLLKHGDLLREADLLHVHDCGVFIRYCLPLPFFRPRLPLYITFHGWEGISPPPKSFVLFRRLAEQLTRGNICIGDFIAKWYGTRAGQVSYGGVRLPPALPEQPQGESALFLGRIASDSGIFTYLEALRQLAARGIELPLSVVGDGPLRKECERFCKEHRLPVRFTGFLQEPAGELAAASHVFVSGYLAILEAMVLGRLVFAVYDNPVKEDYLRMHPAASLMHIAASPEELAGQLEQSLADRAESARMREEGRRWAAGQSWGAVAHLYERLWQAP